VDAGFELAGRYLLERRLGRGGMAEVWQAWDGVLDRRVAVKLVDAEVLGGTAARRRFHEEARAGARLSHPHIVVIHDFGEAEEESGEPLPYLVMELLVGETLEARIAAGPLPAPEAVRVCGQISLALAQAHGAGIVHRDVKPANVFLTPTGVKVLDFGIATLARAGRDGDDVASGEGPAESGGVRDGAASAPPEPTEPLLGTLAYLAPELGVEESTAAVDVYALGVVLTETLTGHHAYDAAALPEDLPVEVADLCARCLAADPADRPTAADVAATLLRANGFAPAGLASMEGDERVGESGPAVPGPRPGPPRPARPGSATREIDPAADLSLVRDCEPGLAPAGATPGRTPGRAPNASPGASGVAGPDDPAGERVDDRGLDDRRLLRGTVMVAAAVAIAGAVLGVAALLGTDRARDGATGPGVPPGTAVPAPAPSGTVSRPAPPGDTGAPTTAPPVSNADAAAVLTAVTRMRPVVDRGLAAGEIRSDVALDLRNVLDNLQRELGAGEPVDVSLRVAQLRDKISRRVGEGGLSEARANELTAILGGV
jgi:eukaryotic-like serine/threonine-protein kinase